MHEYLERFNILVNKQKIMNCVLLNITLYVQILSEVC